jgi:hypothetical protein
MYTIGLKFQATLLKFTRDIAHSSYDFETLFLWNEPTVAAKRLSVDRWTVLQLKAFSAPSQEFSQLRPRALQHLHVVEVYNTKLEKYRLQHIAQEFLSPTLSSIQQLDDLVKKIENQSCLTSALSGSYPTRERWRSGMLAVHVVLSYATPAIGPDVRLTASA